MPTYSISAPNGNTYDVDGPEGATQAQVIAQVLAQHPTAGDAPARATTAPRAPDAMRYAGDAAMTLQRAIPGLSEGSAFLDSRINLAHDLLTGKTRLDPTDPRGSLKAATDAAWNASRDRQQAMVDELHNASPTASALTTGVGYAGQALAAIGSDGATLLPEMEATGARALAGGQAALARFAKRNLAAMPKNATVGGAFAAANAASQPGTLDQRIAAANAAVLPGAAAGIVAPGAIDALSGVGRHYVLPAASEAIAPFLDHFAPGVTSARMSTPQARAAEAIQRAMDRDAMAGHVADTTQPLRHSGGENVASLFDVVAQSPGPGRQIMRTAIDAHRTATSAAIRQDIGDALGGQGDYFATLDAASTRRRVAAAASMAKVGDQLVTLDENAVSALRSDLSRGAIKNAADNALASPDPEARASGAALNRLHDRLLDKPSAITIRVRDAQDISRGLLDAADTAYKGGDGSRGAALKGLGKSVRSNAADPDKGGHAEYGDWLKEYGDNSDHINALKMGRDVFSSKFDMQSENLRSLHGEMSDESKAQFQKGVGEAIIAEVRRKGDISAVRRLLGDHADEFRDRISLAFNDDPVAFGKFIESLGVHADNAARDASYLGNSRTFARDAARKDFERGGGGLEEAVGGLGDVLTGNLPGLSIKGARAAYKALGVKNESSLSDPHANAMIARVGNNPDDLTAMLNMLQARKRIAAAPQMQGRIGSALGNEAAVIAGRRQ